MGLFDWLTGGDKNATQLPTDVSKLLDNNIKLGQEWFDFSKARFKAADADIAALNSRINTWATQAKDLTGNQLKLVERLNAKTLKQADDFSAEAAGYDTAARQAEAAAGAKSDVLTAASDARATAARQAAAMGVRPDSGRGAGIDRSVELSTALASAGAQNEARQDLRDRGTAMRATALNQQIGANNSVIANSGAATRDIVDVGSQELGLNQGVIGLKQGATGIMGDGYNLKMSANSAKAAGMLGHAQDVAAATSQETAGFWNAIGTGAGLLLGGSKPWILSDEELKEDKQPIPEGEALEQVENMPVERWRYKEGVADEGEHIGTYAQDFAEQTGEGDGTGIPVQDAIGVTMKAVQDLSAKVDRIAAATGITDPRKAAPKARGLTPMKKAA